MEMNGNTLWRVFNLIFYWFYILIMNIIAIEILAFHITLLKDMGT